MKTLLLPVFIFTLKSLNQKLSKHWIELFHFGQLYTNPKEGTSLFEYGCKLEINHTVSTIRGRKHSKTSGKIKIHNSFEVLPALYTMTRSKQCKNPKMATSTPIYNIGWELGRTDVSLTYIDMYTGIVLSLWDSHKVKNCRFFFQICRSQLCPETISFYLFR